MRRERKRVRSALSANSKYQSLCNAFTGLMSQEKAVKHHSMVGLVTPLVFS